MGHLGKRLILFAEQFFDSAEAVEDDERENDPRDGKQDDEQADNEHENGAESACCCIGIGRRDHDFEFNQSRCSACKTDFSTQFQTGSHAMTGDGQHVYEVRPRKDKRGADLISDLLPFKRLWYGEPNAIRNAIGYAEHFIRSRDAVILVYDAAGNVIETHERKGDFKEW